RERERQLPRRSSGNSWTATNAAITSASVTWTSCSSTPRRRRLRIGARRSKPCRMHKTPAAFLPLLLLLTAASPPELARWRTEASRVTITRDDWGVAHVHGHTDADAVFGMIYAEAEDDFPRSEENDVTDHDRTADADGETAIL